MLWCFIDFPTFPTQTSFFFSSHTKGATCWMRAGASLEFQRPELDEWKWKSFWRSSSSSTKLEMKSQVNATSLSNPSFIKKFILNSPLQWDKVQESQLFSKVVKNIHSTPLQNPSQASTNYELLLFFSFKQAKGTKYQESFYGSWLSKERFAVVACAQLTLNKIALKLVDVISFMKIERLTRLTNTCDRAILPRT